MTFLTETNLLLAAIALLVLLITFVVGYYYGHKGGWDDGSYWGFLEGQRVLLEEENNKKGFKYINLPTISQQPETIEDASYLQEIGKNLSWDYPVDHEEGE